MTLTRPEQMKKVFRAADLGQYRAVGKIAKLTGDQKPRDLYIVEFGEDTAKQFTISRW